MARSGHPFARFGMGRAWSNPLTVATTATALVTVVPATVTGWLASRSSKVFHLAWVAAGLPAENAQALVEIGRASCRERV